MKKPIIIKAKHLPITTFGLMGKDKPYPIHFNTRFGIHTFFMKFPIDVLILDDKNKVVKTVKSLQPNKFLLWNPKFSSVLELPENTIEDEDIKLGSEICLHIRQ